MRPALVELNEQIRIPKWYESIRTQEEDTAVILVLLSLSEEEIISTALIAYQSRARTQSTCTAPAMMTVASRLSSLTVKRNKL